MMWIDISQPLDNRLAPWPGDTPFRYEVEFSKAQTGSANIGKLTTSTHAGTHVDAHFHYDEHGVRMRDMDIDRYIGECQVIHLIGCRAIDKKALMEKDIRAPRLLVRTQRAVDPARFPEHIPPVTPDAAAYLAAVGVRLLGTDAPSVDEESSKSLDGHHALAARDIYILENAVLDEVAEGFYDLIALPLAIAEGDGSPVRAVIRKREVKR